MLLVRMCLTDAVASSQRDHRRTVVGVRACHKTPKIYCDKSTVPLSHQLWIMQINLDNIHIVT